MGFLSSLAEWAQKFKFLKLALLWSDYMKQNSRWFTLQEKIIGLHLAIIWYLNDLNYYHDIGRSSLIFNYSFFYLFPQHLRLAAWPQVIALIMESKLYANSHLTDAETILFFFQCTVIPCVFGILLPKLFWPTGRKNCSSNPEKLLKFETEGQEFAKFLRSL